MPEDVRIEIIDTEEPLREHASAAEVAGRHTLFTRNGRPVAILLSHDEYLALAETVAIAADPALVAVIGRAERQLTAGDLYDAEDLLVE
ncbi:MAG: type II toxin-antitoxin system prevent-host-death family antitoxin [Thermoanaerobaculia bacterium]